MNYYLVNLTDTYKKVIEEQCLFISKPSGRNIFHWDNLLRVKENDIIFANIGGYIKAICIAKESCIDSTDFINEERRIKVDYYEIEEDIKIDDIGEQLIHLQRKKYGAFCKTKDNQYKANAGYLFELSFGQAEYLFTFIERDLLPREINNEIEKESMKVIQERLDSEYQLRKIYQGIIKPYNDEELLNREVTIEADPRLKATCLLKADYMCEVDNEHPTFKHASGMHDYVECHHIIPLKAQNDFPHIILDDLFNLVALCPLCHAQIHYGDIEAKKDIFYKLYMCRVNEMMEKNITLNDMKRVFEKYYM